MLSSHLYSTKGPSTKDVWQISDILGGGGLFGESSDVQKNRNFSELFKVKTRNYNRSRFQYESIHI